MSTASKFALHGWSDALRCELAAEGIQVTLVSPSTTRSEFFNYHRNRFGYSLKEYRKLVPAASCPTHRSSHSPRKREVILSGGGKLLVYADRLLPGLIHKILKRPRYAKRANAN